MKSVACFRTWRWQGLKLLKCTRENYLFIRSFLSSKLQYIVEFINRHLLLMVWTENHISHDSSTKIDMQTQLSFQKNNILYSSYIIQQVLYKSWFEILYIPILEKSSSAKPVTDEYLISMYAMKNDTSNRAIRVKSYLSVSIHEVIKWSRLHSIALLPYGMCALARKYSDEDDCEKKKIETFMWRSYSSKIHSLIGHTAEVSSAQFNWDCSRIVTGSMDKTCKLWDTLSGTKEQP